jgi:hypothetical protein
VSAHYLFCFHSSIYEATFAIHISNNVFTGHMSIWLTGKQRVMRGKKNFHCGEKKCFPNICSLKQLRNINLLIILFWYVILEWLIKKQHFTWF